MSTDSKTAPKTVLEFKSSSFTVPALVLLGNDLPEIDQQLTEKISQAPEFFKHSPVLIDLQKLNKQQLDIDILKLFDLLHAHRFMPIGIRGGAEHQNSLAHEHNIPVHSLHAQNTPLTATKEPAKQEPLPVVENPIKPDSRIENKLISQPIRSGQRVYAKGDLIITAAVSAGAEIMAEGNIHVYGPLRGRALAGVLGDTASRIFCSDLQAELISIAGIYRLSDDLDKSPRGRPVQVSLQNQALIIKEI